MGGLVKDFALTVLVIILSFWIYDVEETIAYNSIVGFCSSNQTLFLATGIVGSLVLLFSASMFESFGLYKITYGLSKILSIACQFLITFIAIINIVFFAVLGSNLMRDGGYVLLLSLALILGASSWSVRISDFNYHTKDIVLPVSMFALMSVILVELALTF